MDRCAGLDWAKDTHQVCVLEADGEPLLQRGFAHGERDLDRMCELLVELGVKRIAIERPEGVLVEADWSVGGIVTHQRHKHQRVNRYQAIYTVALAANGPTGKSWLAAACATAAAGNWQLVNGAICG